MRFILYFILLRWFFRITFSAQTDPIETVFVAIEGDVSGLLDDVAEGVKESSDELEKLGDTAKKTSKTTVDSAGRMRDEFGRFVKQADEGGTKIKGFGAKAGVAFGLAAGAASKLLDIVINLATGAVQLFQNLTSQAIQLAGNFEQVQLTFTNIFKDREQANAFLKELQSEAAKLGVSFNDAAQFAKSLFPDTKNIEEFNELLRVAAVAAADSGRSLQELIFTFNEAATGDLQSMRDILDLPKDTREAIKAAPGDISVLIKELDKLFTKRGVNNLEAAGSTLQGLQRRIKGFTEELLLVAGLEILGPLREGFQNFFDILERNKPALDELASGIGEIIGSIIGFVREGLGGINIGPLLEKLQAFVDWLNRTSRAFQALVAVSGEFGEAMGPIFNFLKSILGVALMPLIKGLETLWNGLKRVDEALIAGAQILALSAAGWKGLLATLAPIGEVITKIGQSVLALAKGQFGKASKLAGEALDQVKEGLLDVDAGTKAATDSINESAAAIDKWINPVEEATEAVEGLGEQIEDTQDIAAKPLLDPAQLEKFGDQLIEATENRARQQIELEEATAEKINQIVADANQKRLDIDKKFDDALADLARDSEEKRLKVIQDTRQALAELEESTDRQLASRRSEFNKDELRQTEDHLKEMRRLQEDFLFNLDDAVRERDAGAIVDLQRQFQRESAQREEDFSTNQNRQGQDFDAELERIRKNEAQRRNELLAAQAQEIDNINKFEEEKRADIDVRRQEEQEKLEQNLAEKLQKENDNFIERQAALDEALQKQLESIAKNLADQKDVTEEGAREILETFDQFFGIGGDIDQLMEDFARKRKIRADITVAFQGVSAPEPTRPAPQPLAGRPRLGGVSEFAEGGTLIADKPTLALFGEAGPEVVQFTPMSELGSPGQAQPGRMVIEFTGSAPPGFGGSERDQVAAILLTALKESGALS